MAPLSPDEAYYWVWSQALAPGYLDHPPMVALWIWAGTTLVGKTALGVRLLSPISAALGSMLLARAGARLFADRGAGVRAAVLLNATILFGVGAVTMTPDTPLLFFWTVALWALAQLAAGGDGRWWLAVGAAAGLALESKYTAALLGLGIGLWLLTPGMRRHLRAPWPWAGGALAVLVFLPNVLWNAGHGWASFAKQGGRTADWAPERALQFLGELFAGQAGLATPVLAVMFVAGIIGAVRRWRDPRAGLLVALVVPGAAVFLEHAVGDRVQANWAAILYPGAALAAAGLASRWWRAAAALGFALTGLLYVQVTLAPLPLPRALDPARRMAGWERLTVDAGAAARRDRAAFVASEEYGTAALLAWWWRGQPLPVIAAGARWRLFALPAPGETQPGLLLLNARRQEAPDAAAWQGVELLGTLERGPGLETFRLYRVTPRPGAPAAVLPPYW